MVQNQEPKGRFSHSAVAPIIATLLMVAISVVGGILIFVFTQGFFTETEFAAPTMEVLEIFGYDARDSLTHFSHKAVEITTDVAASTGTGNLETFDAVAIYIRNRGLQTATVTSIKMYGTILVGEAGTISATLPTNLEFSCTLPATGVAAGALTTLTLTSGQEGSCFLAYDETINGAIKAGRPLQIGIITANGNSFSKTIQNGAKI